MSARTPPPLIETDPLIGPRASAEDGAAIHVNDEVHDGAVPWKSIFPMVLYRVVYAATYLLIFPFIAELLLSLDADPARVGLYAGIAEGSLMLSEAVFAPVWAKLADRYGRRPVLVLGFAISVLPAVLVGFSTAVWHIIGLRALAGVSPCVIVNKTMTMEISSPKTRARIFSVLSPGFSVGAMHRTFIGGELSHPYDRLPWWLGGGVEFFTRWPYALPCLVNGALIIGATIISYLGGPSQRNILYKAVFRVPDVKILMVMFLLYQTVKLASDAIYSVYTYTFPAQGGLRLPVDKIGLVMSASALFGVAVTPYLLSRLTASYGTTGLFALIVPVWPVLALGLPAISLIAGHRAVLWPAIGAQQGLKNIGLFAVPLSDILLVEAFERYPRLLATAAAASGIVGAIGRAIGPVISGSLYSLSTQFPSGSWGRQIYWIVFLVLGIPPLLFSQYLARDWPKSTAGEDAPLLAAQDEED